VAISKMPIPNAFATGRSPRHAVVAVTQGLLAKLEPDEIEAVLGHELTHVVNRDVAVMTLASFFAMVAFFAMRIFFFTGLFGGGRRSNNGGNASPIWVIYLGSMAVYFISHLLLLALGRYRELAADRGGANLTGHPSHLASALVKISNDMKRSPEAPRKAHESMNAFFIVPMTMREVFSTHPSLERRLEQLDRLSRELGEA
jgi:heat shock protein HtpX